MTERTDRTQKRARTVKVLVAVDFSASSIQALKMARTILGRRPGEILVLHVIDQAFVQRCIDSGIGTEAQVKKTLFLEAKRKLKTFLHDNGVDGERLQELIREGTPFLEINKQAVEKDVDIIVMGNRGTSGDMQTIFFGSTTERVLRFMRRPVLCVPVEEER